MLTESLKSWWRCLGPSQCSPNLSPSELLFLTSLLIIRWVSNTSLCFQIDGIFPSVSQYGFFLLLLHSGIIILSHKSRNRCTKISFPINREIGVFWFIWRLTCDLLKRSSSIKIKCWIKCNCHHFQNPYHAVSQEPLWNPFSDFKPFAFQLAECRFYFILMGTVTFCNKRVNIVFPNKFYELGILLYLLSSSIKRDISGIMKSLMNYLYANPTSDFFPNGSALPKNYL